MLKRGTIVLVPFPFTNLSGHKVRPALIVSKSPIGDDIILAFLSSKEVKKLGVFDVRIVPTKKNGLKSTSIIKCSKIATLEKKVVLGEIGTLSQIDLKKVQNGLKQLFGF
jgi:mRNA interferase MazF